MKKNKLKEQMHQADLRLKTRYEKQRSLEESINMANITSGIGNQIFFNVKHTDRLCTTTFLTSCICSSACEQVKKPSNYSKSAYQRKFINIVQIEKIVQVVALIDHIKILEGKYKRDE